LEHNFNIDPYFNPSSTVLTGNTIMYNQEGGVELIRAYGIRFMDGNRIQLRVSFLPSSCDNVVKVV